MSISPKKAASDDENILKMSYFWYMNNKKVYFMADLVKIIGVHRNTISRKARRYLLLDDPKKRKRYYSETEVEFIKNLFVNDK